MFCSLSAILFNDYSAWWTIACILAGLAYAFIFYSRNLISGGKFFYLLFALRATLVSLICFLLLSPLLQTQRKRTEKPLIIIAQDNSASIKIAPAAGFNFSDFNQSLNKLKESFGDHDVEVLNFGDHVHKGFSTDYAGQRTDVSELFTYIKEQYYGKNVGAVILASDGIFNKGSLSPRLILENKTPVYTIALGDTIPKKDLFITNVNYNKIVYLGNDHYLNVHLTAFQSMGNTAVINVKTSDGQNLSSNVKIDSQDWKQKFNFRLATKRKGTQRISISVSTIAGEISKENNQQTIYVDVLDGREKILILANAPHPDIKALKQSLESNKNYETEILLAHKAPGDLSKYGLVIFHNLPSHPYPIKELLEKSSGKPKWFIIGNQTNVNLLNQTQQQASFSGGTAAQENYSTLNKNFNNFSLSEEARAFFQQVAPLNTIINQYTLKTSGHILLHKRNTEDALFSFTDQNSVKSAFLAGEGLWRWRMENFSRQENHQAFDELVSKTVQYLSAKEDKRKLRVYPAKNRFTDNEPVIINAELYNDAYEAVSDAEISIDFTHSSGKKYSFLFSKKDTFYELNAGLLPEGEYAFIASTNYSNKKQNAAGNFIVEKTNLETGQTTAQHQTLYHLSSGSGGQMVYPDNISSLTGLIKQNEKIKTISYQDKTYRDLADLKWVFFLLLLVLSTEWFLRKRNGVI
jgi:hypothetical protein